MSLKSSRNWLLILILSLIVLAILWWALPLGQWMTLVVSYIKSLGAFGVIIYFILYVGLASISFPNTPLNIGAGIIFSFFTGAPLAITAAFTSSMITFLFARKFAGDWVRQRIDKLPRGKELLNAINDEGIRVVLLFRLNPFIPASVKNYGFGITKIPFSKYAIGTLLGQIPITLIYVYLGWVGGHAMMMGSNRPSTLNLVLIMLGVIVSIILLIIITWQGKKILNTT